MLPFYIQMATPNKLYFQMDKFTVVNKLEN